MKPELVFKTIFLLFTDEEVPSMTFLQELDISHKTLDQIMELIRSSGIKVRDNPRVDASYKIETRQVMFRPFLRIEDFLRVNSVVTDEPIITTKRDLLKFFASLNLWHQELRLSFGIDGDDLSYVHHNLTEVMGLS